MKNTKLRNILSSIGLIAFLSAAVPLNAAPIRFNQVVQVVNAKPGKANIGSFAQLRLADTPVVAKSDDGKAIPSATPTQDRVIYTETTEITEDDTCDCLNPPKVGGGFPKWALLGLAAVPFLFLIPPGDDDDTPTPTPTTTLPPPTQTQTPPPPTETPTPPPPTQTPTPPPMSPTPEPVPEPMTILLFGTGLASVGIAARKRLRKNAKSEDSESEEK